MVKFPTLDEIRKETKTEEEHIAKLDEIYLTAIVNHINNAVKLGRTEIEYHSKSALPPSFMITKYSSYEIRSVPEIFQMVCDYVNRHTELTSTIIAEKSPDGNSTLKISWKHFDQE